jgi:hypothetical protein
MHVRFMNVILLPNGYYNKYIHKTKLHLLVFLINFIHLINARNMKHIKLL